jgi:quinohemoprotein ethanol dehydrogenase
VPGLKIDTTKASAGEETFLASCMYCHGFYAVASGGAPDLRGSTIAADLPAFKQLLTTGALQQKGMPRFDDLGDETIEEIYHYIRLRAEDSK